MLLDIADGFFDFERSGRIPRPDKQTRLILSLHFIFLIFESAFQTSEKTAFRIASSTSVEAIGKCHPSGQTHRPPEWNALHKRLGWCDDSREFGFRCPADVAGHEKPAFGL